MLTRHLMIELLTSWFWYNDVMILGQRRDGRRRDQQLLFHFDAPAHNLHAVLLSHSPKRFHSLFHVLFPIFAVRYAFRSVRETLL